MRQTRNFDFYSGQSSVGSDVTKVMTFFRDHPDEGRQMAANAQVSSIYPDFHIYMGNGTMVSMLSQLSRDQIRKIVMQIDSYEHDKKVQMRERVLSETHVSKPPVYTTPTPPKSSYTCSVHGLACPSRVDKSNKSLNIVEKVIKYLKSLPAKDSEAVLRICNLDVKFLDLSWTDQLNTIDRMSTDEYSVVYQAYAKAGVTFPDDNVRLKAINEFTEYASSNFMSFEQVKVIQACVGLESTDVKSYDTIVSQIFKCSVSQLSALLIVLKEYDRTGSH